MASSIYIYTNHKDYENLYKGKEEAWTFQTPIIDFYLKPKVEGYTVEDVHENNLWIITQTDKNKIRPDLSRSIVHFSNGGCFDYLKGDEKQVEKEKVFYNPKNNHLEFYPRTLRKPLLEMRVDKVIGGKPKKKKKIIYKKKFYDMTNDRLNLFV